MHKTGKDPHSFVCHEYFVKEMKSLQRMFNESFGDVVVINLKLRQAIVLGIIGISLRASDIREEDDFERRRCLVADFMKKRKILRRIMEKTRQQSNFQSASRSFSYEEGVRETA